jgi:hypothetical protein
MHQGKSYEKMDQTQKKKTNFLQNQTIKIFLRFAAAARTLWPRKGAKIKIF